MFYRGILGAVPKFDQVFYFVVQVYTKDILNHPSCHGFFCRLEWFVLHRSISNLLKFLIFEKMVYGSISRTRSSFIWEHLVYP